MKIYERRAGPAPALTISNSCPVCGASHSQPIIEVRNVPVFCNVLLESRREAVKVPRGDIVLEQCTRCGHVYDAAFEPELVEYNPVYENSLHFSPRFQAYAFELATELIERYDLHGKQIVEIGSGRGDFLKLLCELGENSGVGFDPSYAPGDNGSVQNRVKFVADIYTEAYADLPLNFLCSRHTLEHLADPRGFVRMVRKAINVPGGNSRGPVSVYLEVPNVLYTLRDLGIWDLIYEHRSYFCASSLRHLFVANGFEAHRVIERYGGQFLSIEATPAPEDSGTNLQEHETQENDTRPYIDAFATAYRTKVTRMQAALEAIKASGKRCVLWGAGSKGVTFLNVLQVGNEVEFVVDINARKQGKHIAGTGQQIVAPDVLAKIQPDVVLVMNPIYVDEIAATLQQMGLSAELMVV